MDRVSFNNVTKEFKNKAVLKGVSFNIEAGDIYGLIGENGAGKTTLLKLIVNLLKPTSGNIQVLGKEIKKDSYDYLRNIGALIDEPVFYKKLTLYENFKVHCEYLGFYDEEKLENVLIRVGLHNKKDRKIKELSFGEKQKLAIAYALITEPELLILDEPTNGLDPIAIVELREILLKLNREFNTTIIISSHAINELETLVNKVMFLKNGEIVEDGLLEEIKEKCSVYIEIEVEDSSKALAILEKELNIRNMKLINKGTIRVYEALEERKKILSTLVKSDVEVLSFNMVQISLEEYFIRKVRGI
ncbi:ABC transporter ATP-binding protein [Clostridium paraputrificum]|uniref:ABC transporter ATP-binding protein n=1 Tax=Clostridium paraputrificum TaxID=29363 RepID=UPI00189D856A|nr:ABC transporter ATP-binding protein [Clostridium paraputrificum]MDB2092327.1 ABC transporter ATP-binding protein [Clostridium paraputrificum]MDB2100167.1 ABC transporter ATP-binding protein [Clostridium paraputrificum]